MGETVTGLIPNRRAPSPRAEKPGAPRASPELRVRLAASFENSPLGDETLFSLNLQVA